MALLTHTAPGPMAGTLFQPIRALWWLAHSDSGSVVAIEYLDDIAVFCGGELVVLEQDKNSITESCPLTNRSSDLWKTLCIWLEAIRDKEVSVDKTEFHLVTNKTVVGGWVKKLKESQRDDNSLNVLVKELRAIGKKPSATIAPYVRVLFSFSEPEIITLLKRIFVEDATTGAAGVELKQKTVSKLMVPNDFPVEEIYRGLLGWIVETTIRLLDTGEDVLIDRDAFSRCFVSLLDRYKTKRFIETASRLLTVGQEERDQAKERLFVKQLVALNLIDDDEHVIDAIDDWIKRKREVTRNAKEGRITDNEIGSFEDRIYEKWKSVFSKHTRGLKKDGAGICEEEVGLNILEECREHRESLAGEPTYEYYLSRGTFHKLADELTSAGCPRLGWHPKFVEKLKVK